MRTVINCVSFVFVAVCSLSTPLGQAQAQQDMASVYAELYEASVYSIETVDISICGYTEKEYPDDLEGDELIRNEKGDVFFFQTQHAWDLHDGRQRLHVTNLLRRDDVIYYRPLLSAYDGEKYRAYNPDERSWAAFGGLIEPYEMQFRDSGAWLPVILGFNFAESPSRHLWQIIKEDGKVLQGKGDSDGRYVDIEADYKIADKYEKKVVVRLDSDHGYLPSKIEHFRNDTRTKSMEQTIEEFMEPVSGVWIPVKFKHDQYYTDKILPEGMTVEDIKDLDVKARIDIGVQYVSIPLGEKNEYTPKYFVVDSDTIKVNTVLPDSTFMIEFPKGVSVLDRFQTDNQDVMKAATVVKDVGGRVEETGSSFSVLASIVSIVVVVLVPVCWRIMKKS